MKAPVSKNDTVAVGLEPPLTVAVKVTFWFAVEGLTDEVSAVAVTRGLTTCVRIVETLGANVPAPL